MAESKFEYGEASSSAVGYVSTGAQSFAGAKDFLARITKAYITLTDGATPALDASLGNYFYLNSTQNPTIAVPTNPPAAGKGQTIIILFRASSAQRTLSLNTGAGGFVFGTDITGLSATESNKVDKIVCSYVHVLSKWSVDGYIKGFA